MKVPLEPVRGTRDVVPPESERYAALVSKFSEVAELYGYRLVILPTVEHFELYEAKAGPGISRSMYVFQDKAGRTVCLRPEFTASAIRAFLKHLRASPRPLKLYYYGQVFRYDEPQFARYREFFQLGAEYIGEQRIYADIELFQLIRDFYGSVGLRSYSFRVNDISIVRGVLAKAGIPEGVQDEVLHLVDKGEVEKAIGVVRGYSDGEAKLLEKLLEVRAEDPEELLRELRGLEELYSVAKEGIERLVSLHRAVLSLGLNAVADLRLVRGLAYYTGIIFEVSVPGLNVSIGGGGRYDSLAEIYSGVQVPATGFSLGLERTLLALEAQGFAQELVAPRPRLMLVSLVDDVAYVDRVASELRQAGVVTDTRYATKQRLSDLIGQASRLGYDYVAIVGPSEVSRGQVTVKHLRTGEQKSLSLGSVGTGVAGWRS